MSFATSCFDSSRAEGPARSNGLVTACSGAGWLSLIGRGVSSVVRSTWVVSTTMLWMLLGPEATSGLVGILTAFWPRLCYRSALDNLYLPPFLFSDVTSTDTEVLSIGFSGCSARSNSGGSSF